MEEINVEQMLRIGKGCGLNTVEEAYCQIMNHYHMFFLLGEGFNDQLKRFHDKLDAAGLVGIKQLPDTKTGEMVDAKYLIDETIDACAKRLNISLPDG